MATWRFVRSIDGDGIWMKLSSETRGTPDPRGVHPGSGDCSVCEVEESLDDDSDGAEDTGNPSLDGWFYQCDVSVWAALDLLLVKRLASTVQLEPASQEDIEAELDTPTVTSTIGTDTGLLVVQSKLRRSGPWTPATLKKLVKHGKRRPSAATRRSRRAQTGPQSTFDAVRDRSIL